MLSMLLSISVMFSADDTEIFFSFYSYFSKNKKKVLTVHANCLTGDNLHECQIMFWKKMENIVSFSSAEIAQRSVKVNY